MVNVHAHMYKHYNIMSLYKAVWPRGMGIHNIVKFANKSMEFLSHVYILYNYVSQYSMRSYWSCHRNSIYTPTTGFMFTQLQWSGHVEWQQYTHSIVNATLFASL